MCNFNWQMFGRDAVGTAIQQRGAELPKMAEQWAVFLGDRKRTSGSRVFVRIVLSRRVSAQCLPFSRLHGIWVESYDFFTHWVHLRSNVHHYFPIYSGRIRIWRPKCLLGAVKVLAFYVLWIESYEFFTQWEHLRSNAHFSVYFFKSEKIWILRILSNFFRSF